MSLTEEKQNEEFQALFLIIENLLSQIYQYINTQRYQSELLSNIDIWNQICSSLWVLEDSLFSINDYVKSEFPDSDGLKYIFLYGILQALFIQQDAVAHLAEAFEIDIGGRSESLTQIREIRNAAIGHPTKRNHRKKKYFNYISRISMSKYFFTLQVASKDTPDDFKNINIEELINSQLTEIKELLIMINDELSNRDKTHKMEFKDELLVANFDGNLHYQFEKIFSGIFNTAQNHRAFGLSMLHSVKSVYKAFQSQLEDRGELKGNTSLQYELENYFHAIARLEEFFESKDSELSEKDARIYAYYLREEHKYFHEIASEIDEEYSGAV
jgi:hypothetical protein